jgi:uracil phosphoribosyltransferase
MIWPVPLHIVDHPLVQDALMELRDARTGPPAFRRAANRISVLLAAEALRDVPSAPGTVVTPLGPAEGRVVRDDVVVVPVLRAGLGMLDAVLELLPTARVGHIGLQRDEATAIASRYYSKLPSDLGNSYVLMIDPMLATGGSAVAAIDLMKASGARTIRMICIVAAPEGVALVERHHPEVPVYTPVVDGHLDGHKYIVPGLGDFGDRLYGTV